MTFVFRRRGAWVPGCLGGRSREAWAAPPGCLGRIPVAPRGMVPARCLRPVGRHAPLELVSKIMSILMSIFGRFGLDLGFLLGVMLGSCWRLFRPKWVPEPSSNRLIIEKVIFHETLRFPALFGQNGSQDGAKINPRSRQDDSKIVLDRFFCLLILRFVFGSFSAPF